MALLTASDVTVWLQHLASAFAAAATDLARLDEQVGDGDHGETMRRAFHAAAARVRADQADTVQGALEAAAEAFMDAGGGASGPLMASVFVGLARATEGRETLTADVVAEGLRRSRDLVIRMGRCAPGDKTLLDALHPAALAANEAAAREHDPAGVWQAAAVAAASGRDATTELDGKAGRAAWVEGKGRGVADPGATSMALLLEHAARAAAGEQELVSPDAEDNMDAVTDASAVGPDPRAAMLAGKFLNDPADLVNEMIEGFVQAYPDRVRRLKGASIVVRARPKPAGHVGLVIGNGSGHEPIAMGWVGTGLLDANAIGPVFTAPGPVAIARAIAEADRGAGVLLLISHHAGDRIGGEMAAEMARVAGHDVETLLMYDDVASAPKGREAERRGAPGTAFIYKIVGAALEEGTDLAEAKALGQRIRDATRTLAVAVAPGTSPITGQAMFSLPEGEAFIGMGVHGEPGFARMPAHPLDAICARIVDGLIEDGGYESGETVSVFVNGSGGTSLMELLAVARSVFAHLREVGIHYLAPLIGSYVTTQETKGFSVSLCRLRVDDRRRWTAPSDAPFFHL